MLDVGDGPLFVGGEIHNGVSSHHCKESHFQRKHSLLMELTARICHTEWLEFCFCAVLVDGMVLS